MAVDIAVACGNVQVGTGTIRAGIDAVHISVSGVDIAEDDGTPKTYRIHIKAPSGAEDEVSSGFSHLFTPSAEGDHQWDGYIFPEPGNYTIELYDVTGGEQDPIAIASASVANPTVVTTTGEHGLSSGETVTIDGTSGYTPDLDGVYDVTVTGDTTFTVPVSVTTAGTGGEVQSGGVVATEAVTVV